MMKTAARKTIFLFWLSVFFLGCSGNEARNNAVNTQNTAQSNTKTDVIKAKDNIEELETMVSMPIHPEEALWREENLGVKNGENRVPSQNEKKLTAVLNFLPEDSAKIVAQAETKKAAVQTTIPVETWFPAELIAQSELSGDDTLKGNTYNAEQFFKPPFTDGRLIRMENSNYFVLELFSK